MAGSSCVPGGNPPRDSASAAHSRCTSGCLARNSSANVSALAVVSWPASISVMASSRSSLSVSGAAPAWCGHPPPSPVAATSLSRRSSSLDAASAAVSALLVAITPSTTASSVPSASLNLRFAPVGTHCGGARGDLVRLTQCSRHVGSALPTAADWSDRSMEKTASPTMRSVALVTRSEACAAPQPAVSATMPSASCAATERIIGRKPSRADAFNAGLASALFLACASPSASSVPSPTSRPTPLRSSAVFS
mmetsp:Transcript_13384/g.46326  ORF Transcript_13384/g.46326 Transcript_13384/m.46326 type:complete len:251 (+) Transcript_13384:331-1083(+)